jgi:hypothetical protein
MHEIPGTLQFWGHYSSGDTILNSRREIPGTLYSILTLQRLLRRLQCRRQLAPEFGGHYAQFTQRQATIPSARAAASGSASITVR